MFRIEVLLGVSVLLAMEGGCAGPMPADTPDARKGPATVQGAVYVLSPSGAMDQRIVGAQVRLLQTGAVAISRASDGYWSLTTELAQVTVEASAPGYQTAQRPCTVSSDSVWCSIGLMEQGASPPMPFDAGSGPIDPEPIEPEPIEPEPIDAGTEPVDAGGPPEPGDTFAPSHANQGWIGGTCAGPAECSALGEPMCLQDGFPNGMCTRACVGTCPDRGQPNDTISFCIDASPYGELSGICAARCDTGVFPTTGCPQGYQCATRNRYGNAFVTQAVCVPARESGCAQADEMREIRYPDGGKLWIPSEARCGGAFDLVIMLHGIRSTTDGHGWLGRGVRSEHLIRSMIDEGRMDPVILAEPVHVAASSPVLYGSQYSPTRHLDLILPHLQEHGISIRSLSYVGHSGAGCDSRNGMYEVLNVLDSIIPAYAPSLKLWGLADICYRGPYKYEVPIAVLSSRSTIIANMTTSGGDPTAFELGLLGSARSASCDSTLMSSCKAHQTRPWCSFRTTRAAGLNHVTNPYFFVRELFGKVFTATPTACQ